MRRSPRGSVKGSKFSTAPMVERPVSVRGTLTRRSAGLKVSLATPERISPADDRAEGRRAARMNAFALAADDESTPAASRRLDGQRKGKHDVDRETTLALRSTRRC